MEVIIPAGSSAESVNSGGLLSPLFGSSSTIHHHQSDGHLLTEALGSFYSTNSAATLGSQDNFVIQDVQESDEVEAAKVTQSEMTENNVAVAPPPKRPRGPPPKRIPVTEERELIRGLGHDADNLELTSFCGIDNTISEMLMEGMDRMGEEERRVSFNLGMNSQISPTFTHELVSSAKGSGRGHHEMWPDEESHDIVDTVDDTTFPASFPMDTAEGGEWLDEDLDAPMDDPFASSSSSSGRALWYSGMDEEGAVCYYHRLTGESRYDDPFAAAAIVSDSSALSTDEDDTMAEADPIPEETAVDTTIPPPSDAADQKADAHASPGHLDDSSTDAPAREDNPIPDTAPSYITPISPNTHASSHDISVGYEEGTMYKGNIAPPAVTDIIGELTLLSTPPSSLSIIYQFSNTPLSHKVEPDSTASNTLLYPICYCYPQSLTHPIHSGIEEGDNVDGDNVDGDYDALFDDDNKEEGPRIEMMDMSRLSTGGGFDEVSRPVFPFSLDSSLIFCTLRTPRTHSMPSFLLKETNLRI